VRSFRIEAPQPSLNHYTEEGAVWSVPPTFEFSSSGNLKFRLEISTQVGLMTQENQGI